MLAENMNAIPFETEDVYGNIVSLDNYKDKTLLLSFMRYTGCPVCNLHIHQLRQRKEELMENNIEIVFVYESKKETILKYIKNENLPFTFISDPSQKLYDLYLVEKSWSKLFKAFVVKKTLSDTFKGLRKYKKFSSMKGSMNRVGAEFLIGPDKKIKKVHYGKMVGDHMPIENYLFRKAA